MPKHTSDKASFSAELVRDLPMLVLAMILAAFAILLWAVHLFGGGLTAFDNSSISSAAGQVNDDVQIPPLPVPQPESRANLLSGYLPVSKSDPFDPVVKIQPQTNYMPVNSMDPSPETPAPVKPAAPSTPLPKASVPLTPSAVKPSVPAVKVLGIGSAGAYRSSIISIDGNIIMASEGMKIGDSLIVKKIADASVVFVYKNREFVKNLGDVE